MVEGMVAAKAKTRPPRTPALGLIAGEPRPAPRRLLDCPFADSTPDTEKIRMTTAAAECLAGISDRCWQLGTAPRIAAAMPQALTLNETDLQVGLRSGGRYFK